MLSEVKKCFLCVLERSKPGRAIKTNQELIDVEERGPRVGSYKGFIFLLSVVNVVYSYVRHKHSL